MAALTQRTVILTFWVLFVGFSLANGQSVKNIRIENPNEGEVTITYDLEGDPGIQYEVQLFLLLEGDPNFKLKLSNAAGDIGRGRSAGPDRKIVWNAFADYPEAIEGSQYRFEFEVSRHLPLPRLSTVWPVSARQGENLTLQLTGSNFVQGVTTVDAGRGVVVNSLEVRSATQIQASITVSEDAPAGKRSIRVVNDQARGDVSEPKTFTIEGTGGIPWYYYAAGGAAVAGTVLYFVTKPKEEVVVGQTQALPPPPSLP
jgi:hypothetical protein